MNNNKQPLKRRNHRILGVCGGISAYTGLPVTLVRVIALMFMFSPITIATYFIAASMLEKGEDYTPGVVWDYSLQ